MWPLQSDYATLQLLNLAWNSLGDAGCMAFAEALRHNHVLKSVDLGPSAIGPTPQRHTAAQGRMHMLSLRWCASSSSVWVIRPLEHSRPSRRTFKILSE